MGQAHAPFSKCLSAFGITGLRITGLLKQKLRIATSLRKVDLERRAFNPEWTDEFFFVQRGNKAMCLLCHDANNTFKRLNLKGHFDAKHVHTYKNFSADQRKTEAARLQSQFYQQSSLFKKAGFQRV